VATPRRRGRPTLVRLARFPEYSNNDLIAPIGLRDSLFDVVGIRMPKHPGPLAFEVFTPLLFPALTRAPGNPLTSFGSSTECHQHNTASFPALSAQAPEKKPFHPLLPRFFPLQRFASHGEPHNPASPTSSGSVAPSGFLTLSTPCSPRDLPGLFHPGSAHGVHPSRPSSPTGAVRPLERRVPPGVQPNT